MNVNMIGLNLTYKCNLRCYMCGQLALPPEVRRTELDLEAACRLVDEAKPHGLRFGVYLWGGEPLLYGNLIPLIRHIKSKGSFVTINTNGTLLEHMAPELVAAGVDRLIISIDGPAELHDEIRGLPGCHRRIVDGIKAVQAVKKIRPIISTNTVITARNCSHLHETALMLQALKVNLIEFQLPIFFTEEIGARHEERMERDLGCRARSWAGFRGDYHRLDPEELSAQLALIRESVPRHFKLVPDLDGEELRRYFTDPAATPGNNGCKLPWSQIRVEPDGGMVVCPDFPDYRYGSIHDGQALEAFIGGERIKAFRDSLTDNGLFPICTKCCQLYQF